ncbi:Hydroxymethylpyrimidine transporter CytX, partial [Dysosmobacter welbionis]
ALDGDGDGLLRAIQIIEIRILGGRRVRELGSENIIANGKVRLGVFAHYIVLLAQDTGGEIVGADLGRGDHVPGDELAGVNVFCDADDLRLLADALIEQRRDAEADH